MRSVDRGTKAHRSSAGPPPVTPALGVPALALLVGATALAYAGSFAGRFVLDDVPQIVRNPELETIWPGLRAFLTRPRTLTTLTLAWNRALGGLEPWGY